MQGFPAVLYLEQKAPRNWLNSSGGALAFVQIKPTKISLSLFGRLVPEAVFFVLGLGAAVDIHLMGALLQHKGEDRKQQDAAGEKDGKTGAGAKQKGKNCVHWVPSCVVELGRKRS